jgi:murein DD-endopeptidase MepM/ murein hydrolase activator NlpD
MKHFKAIRNLWLVFFILTIFTSGCSFKFHLTPAKTTPSVIYHVVQKGETLWHISQVYNSSVAAIKDVNNLITDEIEVNQRLLIPHAEKTKKIPSSATPRIERPVKLSAIIKPTPKRTTGAPVFSRPLSGKILSTTEEAKHEGRISIEGKPGETITTSRAGQVFFTGETKGYSTTLIVDHLDGFYSVYGGDIEITARKGEILTKNGIIGKMISTREKPKLFFEIRRGTEPVNPLNYLNK